MTTRSMRPQTFVQILALSCVLLLVTGCNLGTSASAPPTLMPRPSATPPPPMGVVAASNNMGQIVPESVNTPIARADLEVYNLINQVDTDRLMVHIERLQNFWTRHVNSTSTSTTSGIGAARTYIKDQFDLIQRTSPGTLYTFIHEFDMNYNGIATKQQNVVAVIQGTQAGAGTLVIGAHYDSIVEPDFTNAEAFAPGAYDNGSGVAALIEIARVMAQRQYRMSVMFVAFSAEEVNRVGSRRFVEYLQAQRVDVVGMINIDGIGNNNDRSGRINDTELRVFSAGPNDSSLSRHMARSSEFISFTHGLDMKLIVEDAQDREERYGDHFSFSEAGIPAIRFISALEEKRNGDPTDTIEFVDPGYLRRATQAILMVTTSLADGPRPPRNVTLRSRDDGMNTLIWEPVPDATGYVVALRWPGSLRYDQQIEHTDTTINWEGFASYVGIAIAAKGPNGVVGPLSAEYPVPR